MFTFTSFIFAIFFVTKVCSDQFLFLTTPAPKGYNDLYTLSTLIYFDKNIKINPFTQYLCKIIL